MGRRLVGLSVATGIGSLLLAAASSLSAAGVDILPHRAFYTLNLDSTAPGNTLTDVRGALFVEWTERCEGWSGSQRLQLRLTDATRPTVDIDTRFSSWEEKGSLGYRFSLLNLRDGVPEKELSGRASLEGVGKPGVAVFSAPPDLRIDLPAGVIFPYRHLLDVVEGAIAGKKVISRSVFDGTDEEGFFEINAVIGPSRDPDPDEAKLPAAANQRSWVIRLAFFSPAEDTVVPFYEMTADLLENGISRWFLLDYGDWVVRADLDRIELLPRPSC